MIKRREFIAGLDGGPTRPTRPCEMTEFLLDFFHFFQCLTLHLEESFPTGRVFGSPVISAKSMQVHDAQRGAIPRSAPAAGLGCGTDN
jgi:hypothetical protein